MTNELGSRPESGVLNLVRDSDFVCNLRSDNGDWPDTAEITLLVADQTWTAALDADVATFSKDLVDVNAAIAESPRTFRVFYEDGSARFEWIRGPVRVYA